MEIISLLFQPLIWVYKNIKKEFELKKYKQYIVELLEFIQNPSSDYEFNFAVELRTLNKINLCKCSNDDEILVVQALYRLSEKHQLNVDIKNNILNILKNTTPNVIYQDYNSFGKTDLFFFVVSDKSSHTIIHKEITSRYIYRLTSTISVQNFLDEFSKKKFDVLIKRNI